MSLINDALKRAAEAQNQGQSRPRGPKGVEDLPVPMTPTAVPEKPSWVPLAGVAVVVVLLLSASGYFFMKWWHTHHAPPVATVTRPATTNAVPATNLPPVKPATEVKTNPPVATNLVVKTNPTVVVPVVKPVVTNPPVVIAVTNPPVVTPTNPSPVVIVPPVVPTNPPPVVVVVTNPPVVTPTNPSVVVIVPPVVTNPPPVVVATNPPVITATNPPVIIVSRTNDPPKKVEVVAVVEDFPELKLQGIILSKKKPTATVNNKVLTIGDRVEGAFLLKIDRDSVTFEKGGVKKEFFLLR